ncbi:Diguanylate cyclase DosC [Novipirellula aureliae]|uniref:diguanylate cyclase n=1 Tax=Novipirellula aureliae TaxID=2527966 RepID=A0A5C6DGR1_9BACT|nr:diguanylate cyclase [Novipirellula aureliae]TWU34169.1 Diguanylate cyclase DosC [Novipirellula aureliae]
MNVLLVVLIQEFIASFRLAVALVCVGVSLILGGQWLGFVPNAELVEAKGRQALCESIAINASGHLRHKQWVDLKTMMRTQVERNDQLLSIGLRSDMGTLRLDTGHHAEMWPKSDDEATRVLAIRVPITLNRRPWGDVEFCFRQSATSAFSPLSENSVYRLVAFFALAGLGSYTLFVARIMGVFSRTQVVPDRVRQALDTLAEGLLVLDEEGRIILANRAFATTVGMDNEELTFKTAADLAWSFPSTDRTDPVYPWVGAIAGGELQSDCILHYRLPDGRNRIFSVNAAPLGGDEKSRGALATFRDVTHVEEHREELEKMLGLLRNSRDEIEKKNGELEILATQDALTGCLNRRAFFERFETLWADAKANKTTLSCIMIDNDHFKNVNDTYGHHIGDEVLRRVSALIRKRHQHHGLVCRYGGEEFCVVLPNLSLREAINEAEQTREAISQIVFDDPAELTLTASLGVSELRFNPSDTQELINQADCCLYVAKREGRNRVICYNNTMQQESEEAAKPLERVKAKQLNVSYQAVTGLMSALSYRDAKTAEHGRRVADLCSRVADQILDPAHTYLIEVAALLHEIGKIGVPDSLLLKSDKWSASDLQILDRHNHNGLEIIAGAFNCKELTALIRAYYQYQRRGMEADAELAKDPHLDERIRWSAKLLVIADNYDSMVSGTGSLRDKSHAEAMAYLRRDTGNKYDAAVVAHFIDAMENRVPTLAAGAFSIGKQAAIQIGMDVERLTMAITKQDLGELKLYVDSLATTADQIGVDSIAFAARQIDMNTEEDERLLIDIHTLLDIARNAQTEFLRESLELKSQLTAET